MEGDMLRCLGGSYTRQTCMLLGHSGSQKIYKYSFPDTVI